jgi:hypothetical protein
MFVFVTETCGHAPRGHSVRVVKADGPRRVHPQEALLQQTPELQASPAFAEARRRRQVVEHRIARLVQLGIHQAHRLVDALSVAALFADVTIRLADQAFTRCCGSTLVHVTTLSRGVGEPPHPW